MATINKGIPLSEVTWSSTDQYTILQVLIPGGVGGEAVYFTPVVTNAGIQYTANKVDANGAPIQPTKGTAPAAEPTAWTVTGGGGDVTGTLLTGLVAGAGTIVATDTILQGFNKSQGNFNTITAKPLTGLVAGAGTIAPTDTILQGFNKTQGNFDQIGTSSLRAVPQGSFDVTIGVTPIDFPINDTAMTISKSADIIVDPANFYTLPQGHIYIAEVVMRGNTFDANSTTLSMQFNINSSLQPQVAMSNPGATILVGSQGSMTAIINTIGGPAQFKIQASVSVGLSAKVSSSGAVSTGGGFSINIYSIR